MGRYLQDKGYRIIVLNLVNMDESDGYNPFEYIRSDEDIVKLITNLIANTTPKNANTSTTLRMNCRGQYMTMKNLSALYLSVSSVRENQRSLKH